jgi:hypothetical protein
VVTKWIVLGLLLPVMVSAGVGAAAKQPPREFFGLQLGVSEEVVHRHMRKIATQEKEEKEAEEGGEQEVWILKHDFKIQLPAYEV